MTRCLLVIIVGILSCLSAQAQHWLGLSSSNYAGTNALFLNPAHAADSRHKLYINLIGNDFFLINNYLRYDAPYSFISLITNSVSQKYRSERGLIIWKDTYYAERLNGKPKHFHTGGDLRGPSALFSFKNNRFAIALTTRGRYTLNLTDVSEETARVIRYGTNLVELQSKDFTNQTAKLSTNGFVEMGATFGAVLADWDEDFLKIGVTVKRLVGVYNVHADMQDAAYRINVESLNPEREFILASKLQATYGYTTEEAFSNLGLSPQFLFGNRSAGGGWGFDLGAVYEYRPDVQKLKIGGPRGGRHHDPNKNKYKYRISAALTDIGAIRYKNLNYVREIDVDPPAAQFSYAYFNSLPSTGAAVDAVNRSIGVRPADTPRGWTVGLPTSFNASFDYHHKNRLYVNALWVQGLGGKNYADIKPQSVFAITPRYETKWFEVSTPLAMVDNYRVFTVGLATRIGPVIIGTDHLGGLLDIGKPQGLDFYFGLYAPFFHRKPDDPNKCWYQPYEKSSRRKR
ncbi:DUF5723 family protein [Runella aurantiaca]|uniref:DUF5723 domain-containing protein n=1 Tax=Runella aurantiaca TaxID=2282308 RepID=A0A369I0N5_9BACT|nr:DUF5723 family protein [Runella aurantiaca]RDB03098.1 hypothetical protein DVG78_25375 [Runella aurantiaca]